MEKYVGEDGGDGNGRRRRDGRQRRGPGKDNQVRLRRWRRAAPEAGGGDEGLRRTMKSSDGGGGRGGHGPG